MAEIPTIIEAEIILICDKYNFSSTYHVHVLGSEDRVTSCPKDQVVVYEKFFCAGLRFPLYPFIVNICEFYQVGIELLSNFVLLHHSLSFLCYLAPNVCFEFSLC